MSQASSSQIPSSQSQSSPAICPPFTDPEQAARKVQMAEDLWNTRDADRVAAAYTEDCVWRNRVEFFAGRRAIVEFLRRKWARELDYRLKKELWGFRGNRMAVKFQYEWHDDSGQWFRSYGNELWEFAPSGLMQRREASINDLPIGEEDRVLLG
jgi:hypothetical protein